MDVVILNLSFQNNSCNGWAIEVRHPATVEGARFIQRSNERNDRNWSRTMETSYMGI